MSNFTNIAISAVAILIILTTHEYAHGLVAYWNGDDTAKRMGRLTLNPLAHLDLLGTFSMLIFRFGWAKPVPINPNNFRKPRFGMFTVAIAGVVTNLLTAFIFIMILPYFKANNILSDLVLNLAFYGILFAVFNMIPIPPLDGSKVIASFAPNKLQYFIYKYERYFSIILIALLYTGFINRYLEPAVYAIFDRFLKIALMLRIG